MKSILLLFIIISCSVSLPAQEKTKKEYYPNGKIRSVITYSDSLRDGEAKFYYENGNPEKELTYVNGKVEGTVKLYYKNGAVKEVYTLTDGKREGAASYYDSSGTYLKDIAFKNGMLDIKEAPLEIKENKNDSLFSARIERLKTSSTRAAVPPKLTDEHLEGDPVYYPNPDVKAKPVGGMTAIYDKLVYPDTARQNRIEGTVEISTFIDDKGNVVDTKVLKSLGYGCDKSAQTAIKYTKFTPAEIKGRPVKSLAKISIDFKMKKN